MYWWGLCLGTTQLSLVTKYLFRLIPQSLQHGCRIAITSSFCSGRCPGLAPGMLFCCDISHTWECHSHSKCAGDWEIGRDAIAAAIRTYAFYTLCLLYPLLPVFRISISQSCVIIHAVTQRQEVSTDLIYLVDRTNNPASIFGSKSCMNKQISHRFNNIISHLAYVTSVCVLKCTCSSWDSLSSLVDLT